MKAEAHTDFPLHTIDTRLVAAVQTNAGARSHESGNLLQYYYLAACVYEIAFSRHDGQDADCASQAFEESEVALRRFLFQCLWPAYCRV